jgi:hypothetical protein
MRIQSTEHIAPPLRGNLEELLKTITGGKTRAPAEIIQTLGKLDALLVEHAGNLPPRLQHFLEGRSYHKALAYLDGATPASGACSPQPAK